MHHFTKNVICIADCLRFSPRVYVVARFTPQKETPALELLCDKWRKKMKDR